MVINALVKEERDSLVSVTNAWTAGADTPVLDENWRVIVIQILIALVRPPWRFRLTTVRPFLVILQIITTKSPLVSVPFDFPKEEEKVLAFWREIDAFQTSLKLSEGKPIFSFYDGPPFATGLPHYGHLLAGTIKVAITALKPAQTHQFQGYRYPACPR